MLSVRKVHYCCTVSRIQLRTVPVAKHLTLSNLAFCPRSRSLQIRTLGDLCIKVIDSLPGIRIIDSKVRSPISVPGQGLHYLSLLVAVASMYQHGRNNQHQQQQQQQQHVPATGLEAAFEVDCRFTTSPTELGRVAFARRIDIVHERNG